MIDFEEELKKFHKSLEVEEVEQEIYKKDLTDITDVLQEIVKEKTRGGNGSGSSRNKK